MKLKAGAVEEYKKRHADIWPELVDLLYENGVSNYSIIFDEETHTLFAFQNNIGAGSQDLGSTVIVQKWWAYMADIMAIDLKAGEYVYSNPLNPTPHYKLTIK